MDSRSETAKGLPDCSHVELADLLYEIGVSRDTVAMERLFRVCHRSVYAIAFAISHDPGLSEDIFQETMLYIWMHAADYRRSGNPTAWIYVIARHIAIDIVRKRRGWVPLNESITTDSGPSSEKNMELKISLQTAIGRLGIVEAQVFVLKDLIGLPLGLVADILDLSYRRTSYRHRKAKMELKEFLSDAGKDGDNNEKA